MRWLDETDWTTSALRIDDPRHLRLAGQAIAQGAIACHPFANFYVFTARPNRLIVRYVNAVKGRPADQTGSVVTTPEHLDRLFDWRRLPMGLQREQILELVTRLLAVGPFGFRGPAADHLPDFLTADDLGVRTVQVISPGNVCPSNDLFAQALERIPQRYLYGTSGNLSRRISGTVDEPVHYRLAPLQSQFGRAMRFFMLGQPDETQTMRKYPLHQPTSTSVLSFHKVCISNGQPYLVLERHGSMHVAMVRAAAARVGLGVKLSPVTATRLQPREYMPMASLCP